MDSPYFEYSVAGTDSTHSSHCTVSSVPARLHKSLQFDLRNSPNSPLSAHFKTETLAVFCEKFEQQSESGNLTVAIPSAISSPIFQNHLPNEYGDQIPNDYGDPNIRTRLRELESALMAADVDEGSMATTSGPFLAESSQSETLSGPSHMSAQAAQETSNRSYSRQSESPRESQPGSTSFSQARIEMAPPDNLKHLLIACARALDENSLDEFEHLVGRARSSVSISGEPMQRLGAYLVEGLVARRESSGTNIYRALKCNQPNDKELLSYMHILYEVCPYLKFGYMAANGAIAEACKGADRIHIVDFQIAQGTQWITLLQALAARPGGPPRVRITGIDDAVSKYARGDGLAAVGRRLAVVSEKFGIPVEFCPVAVFGPDVTREMLEVRPGEEALAVNFPLQLHHTPDESVDVSNPRDGLLRMVKSLSPTVVTLVEQESNTNTAPFVPRFVETLDYYSAMFESIDVTMGRGRKERIGVEQHCLARDIVNIVACEGRERVERHELFGKWRMRLTMAGFRQLGLNTYVNSVIWGLLRGYSENYTLVEKDGAMLLGWKERNLVSASAWH